MRPELSVLIPAYNGALWIAETLRRLEAAAGGVSVEAVVVDNASSDATADLAEAAPGSRVIRNASNRGFSGAVNQAAAAARGRLLAVVNQDLHLEPRSLRVVRDFLAAENALAGGALAYEDGRPQPSGGPFPTLAGTLGRLLLPREVRKYYLGRPRGGRAQPVDWVTGAFLAFRRELFDRLGGFDESYFMYYEDVDFCLRARRAGFRAYVLPDARAVHLHPYGSRRDAPDWLRREIRFSQMRYFDKHRPGWERGAVRLLNRACFAAKGWPWR